MTHTENKSITPRERPVFLVSRRRPCPKERGDPLLKEQGDLLLKQVKNNTLNTHRLGLFWRDKGSKSSPTVRRRLENTNSRLVMTEEVYKYKVKRSSPSKKSFIVLKQKNSIDEINNFFMNSY